MYAGHYGGNTVWEAAASRGIGTAGDAPMPSGVKAGQSAVWKRQWNLWAEEVKGKSRAHGQVVCPFVGTGDWAALS
ncbi:hypothetical protein M5Y63_01305 [Neisseria meningitidis]|uniref:hypothetical protein n=1 Tax=Neisseria meningitidis TaxID=487 RepID=UPI0013DF22DC|nr:hypothetical protein [Neisseria meningitidis]MCL4977744.1 hypothetical protein [Neisseria meningitidis]MCL4997738.1 hypothetical protein [Neisseria meningitidis]MCL5763074.1 hypothetical protein [Neisseria meningitidis]MCL5863765.1 hypothetical protein [Neisseria meningitidis]MCL5916134.1 hypothetical protein [Neisseria meningitidis]